MEQRVGTSTSSPQKSGMTTTATSLLQHPEEQLKSFTDSLKSNVNWYQSRIEQSIGNKRSFTVLTAVWGLFAMYMAGKQQRLESILDFSLPDTVFMYRPVRVFETVAVLGRSGREAYSDFLVIDFGKSF
jgi:hypothetical protein